MYEEWMKMFIKLSKRLERGLGYPKANSLDEEERELYDFVRTQRQEYINNTLDKFKEKLLNDIGFYWGYDKVKNDSSLSTWLNTKDDYSQELVNRNGAHIKRDGERATNRLISWERLQKKEEKKGGLDADKEYELRKVGFYFDDSKREKSQRRSDWFKNYNKLIALLTKVNGDYDKLKDLSEFKSIAKWYNRQIREEQKGGLEEYRRILLENIAFPFEPKYKIENGQ